MAYNPIKAEKNALDLFVSYISKKHAGTVNELIGNAGLIRSVSEDLFNRYLSSHKENASSKLKTKILLEEILYGADISSIMEAPKTNEDGKYRWETGKSPVTDKLVTDRLDEIRNLANAMYRNVRIPFVQMKEYSQMISIAQKLYESLEKEFVYGGRIVSLSKELIGPATIDKLAMFVFETAQQPNQLRVYPIEAAKQGLRALMYLKEKHPDSKIIPKLIKSLAEQSKNIKKRSGFVEDLQRIIDST